MRISLCMITKDEERNLERCLNSAQACADEICIVDTGSRDRTVEIAQRLGAHVVTEPWRDDFAAARNVALAMATGDWILALDADDVLADDVLADTGVRDRLKKFAAEHPTRAGQMTVRDQDVAGNLNSEVHTLVTRFFPRNQSPSYVGRIHEQLVFAGAVPPRAETGVDIVHYGYTQDAMAAKGKGRRNIRMLRAELVDQPQCPYLWYQLGLSHLVAGEHEHALKALTGALTFAADIRVPYIAHLTESLCVAMRAVGHSAAALELIAELELSFVDRADTIFQIGLLSMDTGNLERAERCFLHCLALAGTRPKGGAYTPSASTTAPAHNLGVMHEVCGSTVKARHYYRMALSFDSRHQPSLIRLGEIVGASPVLANIG